MSYVPISVTLATKPKLDEILAHVGAYAESSHPLASKMMHAYVGCIQPDQLADAIFAVIEQSGPRRAICIRFLRLAREDVAGVYIGLLDSFALRLLAILPAKSSVSRIREALLSYFYLYFSPPLRVEILERWRGKSTRDAMNRWLKAIAGDEFLLDLDAVAVYWRASRDSRAAKLLVFKSPSERLPEVLPDLVQLCDEGWIIGKAVIRAGGAGETIWHVIRERHPATYAYLCAKLGRAISDIDALAIVRECAAMYPDETVGLALWAIGQMGLWNALQSISMIDEEINTAMFEAHRAGRETR